MNNREIAEKIFMEGVKKRTSWKACKKVMKLDGSILRSIAMSFILKT